VSAAGTIVFANQAACEIAGARSMLARTPSRLLPQWHLLSTTSARSFRRETTLLRSDGGANPVELSFVRFGAAAAASIPTN
jgi:PAS domain-containing protein